MKLSFSYSGKRLAPRKPLFQSKQDSVSPKSSSDTNCDQHSLFPAESLVSVMGG